MKVWSGIAAGIVATLFAGVAWSLVSATDYGGGNVQSYAAERPIEFGTIVRLSDDNSKQVAVATKEQAQNIFGVTIDPRQLSVRISGSQLKNESYVAVSGTYNTLVSTQNGPIAAGDYLELSSLRGIAMKAGDDEVTVFGRAAAAFDGEGVTRGTARLKDEDGNQTKQVVLGSIPVTIDIRRNPNQQSTKTNLPEFLERAGQAIAEKEVSPIRMYLSLAITAVSLITAIVVIYSGVRSGVISIGRNPMSKKSIFRALLQIILTSFLILIIGLFAVYLLLRL